MKLVHRVSLFFLAALAVVLVVYSGVFYVVVRGRLEWQFEQELHAALHSLVAAVEVEPEEVKWQPLEHTIALGAVRGPDEVRWAVIGDGEIVVQTSLNATPELTALAREIAVLARRGEKSEPPTGRGEWRILQQRLVAPAPDRSEREPGDFDDLVVVVAHSAATLNAELRNLLLLVGVLPVGVWLPAATVGQAFCRRALQPVLEMSTQARAMTGTNFQTRLPEVATDDELADLAEAFNTLLDRRQRAFEQQRRFTGDAAHELRTPLTILLGQIDVALRRSRTPQEYGDTLRLLREQTSQLQQIVESLLFLARAEEDAALPDLESIPLGAWLPEYLRRWDNHPRRSDVSLRIDPDRGYEVAASPALLARLLDNLVENALKYSPPGTPVEIGLTCGPGEASISVQDFGGEISAEDLPNVLQPFFRTRSARESGVPGVGLGLAIAARIATAFGGRLECESEIDRGNCFTVWLKAA